MSLLAVTGLRVVYPPVVALAHADLHIEPGEVHAVIGPNGAGKSSLVRALTGQVTPAAGTITWADLDRRRPQIGVVTQQSQLCPGLSVADNLLLGHHPLLWRTPLVDRRETERRAAMLLERVGAGLDPGAVVDSLSPVQRRFVEIARAVAHEPDLVIFDEPTAALGHEETTRLLRCIRDIAARGTAVMFISHRLDEVVEAAHRVTVLVDGTTRATLERGSYTKSSLVQQMVLGDELSEPTPAPRGTGQQLLEVLVDRVPELAVDQGEIVVLAGLEGSGRASLLQRMTGTRPAGVSTRVRGRHTCPRSTAAATRVGLRLVPDQREAGLIGDLSVEDNLILPLLAAGELQRWGFVRRRRAREVAKELAQRFDVVADSVTQPLRELSGGNQQKVMVAAALAPAPEALLVDEPTQGVDVAARAGIHRILVRFVEEGGAVVASSSDDDECAHFGNRVAVMRGGHVVRELRGADRTREAIVHTSFTGGET
jgi:ABC-type sugar transport system ATPase subunit